MNTCCEKINKIFREKKVSTHLFILNLKNVHKLLSFSTQVCNIAIIGQVENYEHWLLKIKHKI